MSESFNMPTKATMSREYTPFERSTIASLAWQIKGFRENHVPEDATRRILRATLRRIGPISRGRSTHVTRETSTHIDHCIPISVVAGILLDAADTSIVGIYAILDRHLRSAELTQEEHRVVLREYHSTMPSGWDPDSTDPDNDLARYGAVGITLVQDPDGKNELDTEIKDRPASERFPMRAFRPWAESNDLSDDVGQIDELASRLPQRCQDRASTFRRGLAIELLEQENLLTSFLNVLWPYGLTAAGHTEMNQCKNFARRCRESVPQQSV